jgi:hypothetical protein
MVSIISTFSQEMKVFNIYPQSVIQDKDVFRYIATNVIDNQNGTVFACHRKDINPALPVIKIVLSEPIEISSLTIKAGYFEEKYYLKNDRIKKIRVVLYDNSVNVIYNKEQALSDRMENQVIDFLDSIRCNEIDIFVLDVYQGTLWDDICISEVSFSNFNEQIAISIDPVGISTVAGYFNEFEYRNGVIISEWYGYEKAFDEKINYYYNDDGNLIAELHRTMSDPNSDQIQIYIYKNEKNKHYDKRIYLTHDGTIEKIEPYINPDSVTTPIYKGVIKIGEINSDNVYYRYIRDNEGKIMIKIPVAYTFSSFDALTYIYTYEYVGEIVSRINGYRYLGIISKK